MLAENPPVARPQDRRPELQIAVGRICRRRCRTSRSVTDQSSPTSGSSCPRPGSSSTASTHNRCGARPMSLRVTVNNVSARDSQARRSDHSAVRRLARAAPSGISAHRAAATRARCCGPGCNARNPTRARARSADGRGIGSPSHSTASWPTSQTRSMPMSLRLPKPAKPAFDGPLTGGERKRIQSGWTATTSMITKERP